MSHITIESRSYCLMALNTSYFYFDKTHCANLFTYLNSVLWLYSLSQFNIKTYLWFLYLNSLNYSILKLFYNIFQKITLNSFQNSIAQITKLTIHRYLPRTLSNRSVRKTIITAEIGFSSRGTAAWYGNLN